MRRGFVPPRKKEVGAEAAARDTGMTTSGSTSFVPVVTSGGTGRGAGGTPARPLAEGRQPLHAPAGPALVADQAASAVDGAGPPPTPPLAPPVLAEGGSGAAGGGPPVPRPRFAPLVARVAGVAGVPAPFGRTSDAAPTGAVARHYNCMYTKSSNKKHKSCM
jgi:hypothetical protein